MKLTSRGKLNKFLRRVTSLTLCLVVIAISCVFDIDKAEAVEDIKGWEWTRIYSTNEMSKWNNRIKAGNVRVLIVYGDDKFYIAGQNDYDGAMYGKIVNSQMNLKQSRFTSMRDFQTPILKYDSWDENNNCNRYNIYFTDTAGNMKNQWLYHENAIFPFIWKGFFVFYPGLWDHQSDDEVAFTICSDRWNEHSFQFSPAYNNYDRDDFIQLVLDNRYNHQKLSDLSPTTLTEVYAAADRYIKTVNVINGYSDFNTGIYQLRDVDPTGEIYAKDLYYDKITSYEGEEPDAVNPNDKKQSEAFAAECKKIKEKYTKMKVAGKTLDKLGTLKGDEWNDGEARIFYNIPKRLDTAWRWDGSEVYDSWSWTGKWASFKIYLGVQVSLPTIKTDTTVGEDEGEQQEQQKKDESVMLFDETKVFDSINIAEGVVLRVNKGSTIIIRGQMILEGILEVYGNVIVDDEACLCDMRNATTGATAKWHEFKLEHSYYVGDTKKKESWKGNIPNCQIHVHEGGMMYISPKAALIQYKNTNLIVDKGGSLICDGALMTMAGIEVGGTLEIGPSGEAAFGGYPTLRNGELIQILNLMKTKSMFDLVISQKPVKYNDGKYHQDLHIVGNGVLKAYGTIGIYKQNNDSDAAYPIKIDNNNVSHIICYEGTSNTITQALSGFAFYVRNEYQETYYE